MNVSSILASLALGVISTTAVHAQQMKVDGMGKMDTSSKSDQATHNAVGIVKSVDKTKNTVTFVHEPVKSLNWPAMTMAFQVKNKALFDNLSPGKKVSFEFVQQDKEYVVITVK